MDGVGPRGAGGAVGKRGPCAPRRPPASPQFAGRVASSTHAARYAPSRDASVEKAASSVGAVVRARPRRAPERQAVRLLGRGERGAVAVHVHVVGINPDEEPAAPAVHLEAGLELHREQQERDAPVEAAVRRSR